MTAAARVHRIQERASGWPPAPELGILELGILKLSNFAAESSHFGGKIGNFRQDRLFRVFDGGLRGGADPLDKPRGD
jgi:hypothetical protein